MAATNILKVGGRDFEVSTQLGKGGFSTVLKGIDVATKKQVALKITYIDTNKLAKQHQIDQITAEIKIMRKPAAQHPNIIKLLGYDLKGTHDNKPCIVMVQQLACRKELFEYLMHSGLLGEKLSRTIFLQLARALKHLHNEGVAHRDLKPENLLFDANFKLKIADFGFAMSFAKKAMKTELGTRGYMAPEILERGEYSSKVDVFASGVILFILVSCFPPFRETRDSDWWFNKIIQGKVNLFWLAHERKAKFSTAVKELITSMIQVDPNKRPSLTTILNSKWCKGEIYNKEEYINEMSNRHDMVKKARVAQNQVKRGVFGERIENKVKSLEAGQFVDLEPLIVNYYREKFKTVQTSKDTLTILMELARKSKKKNVQRALSELSKDLEEDELVELAGALAELESADDLAEMLGLETDVAEIIFASLNEIELGLEDYDHSMTETLLKFEKMELPEFDPEYQDPLECYNFKGGLGTLMLALKLHVQTKKGAIKHVIEDHKKAVNCIFNIVEKFDVPTANDDDEDGVVTGWTTQTVEDRLIIEVALYKVKGKDNKIVFMNRSDNCATAKNFKDIVQEICAQTAVGPLMNL